MENRFGFIREKIDIKILTLYVLARCASPVDFDRLCEMTICDGGISYFDFAECLDELVSSGHVNLDEGLYTITDKGLENVSITETNVPFTIRKKATANASDYNAEEARKDKINASYQLRNDNGYDVFLSLSDGVANIINIQMYADNERQAQILCKGFQHKAEKAYNAFLEEIIK